jgi:hypothetical protein
MNTNRTRTSRALLIATLAAGTPAALGLSVQACGSAGPDGEPTASGPAAKAENTGKTAQDLSILGIQLPEPTVTIALNDASLEINPIGLIDQLFPPIVLPDPLKPVNGIIGAVEEGGTVSVTTPGLEVNLGIPGLPVPRLPDPFDGGIPLLVP